VIAARNEEGRIGKCLDSLLNQTYSDYEIVVVNDGSTDRTAEIVISYIEKTPSKIKLHSTPGLGPRAAFNSGIKAAASEVVACIGADDEVNPEYLERLMKHFEDSKVIGVCVRMVYRSGTKTWGKVQDVWKTFRSGGEIGRFPMVFKKQVFEEIGGFTGRLSVGEDYDINKKMKQYTERNDLKMEAEPGAVYYCVSEDTLPSIYRHAVKFGEKLPPTVKYYPIFGGPILLWSIFNAIIIVAIPLAMLQMLRDLIFLYLVVYVLLWLSILVWIPIKKKVNYSARYYLLTPVLQIVSGIGVSVGVVKALIDI